MVPNDVCLFNAHRKLKVVKETVTRSTFSGDKAVTDIQTSPFSKDVSLS